MQIKKWRDKNYFLFFPFLLTHTGAKKKRSRKKRRRRWRERSSAKSVFGRRVIFSNLR